MSRPYSITPEISARFTTAIEAGASFRKACGMAEVPRTTAQRWMEEIPEFNTAVEKARCNRTLRWLSRIEERSKKDWKAAAWLLEHVETDEFGKSIRASVNEEIQSFLNGLKARLGSHAWREILGAAHSEATARGMELSSSPPRDD